MFRKKSELCGVLVLVLLGLTVMAGIKGCGGGGGSSSATGTLQVGLTDKSFSDYSSIRITIREVRVVQNGRENLNDNNPGLPIIATFTPPILSQDITKLDFLQQVLGTAVVPAGTYTQVRLILEPNRSGEEPVNYVRLRPGTPLADTLGTGKIPLDTPSGQQSGVKVLGRFVVQQGVFNAILIDFDPSTAVVLTGNNKFILKPTGIRIVQPATPLPVWGSLYGTIVFSPSSTATVSVVPQGQSSAIAAGLVFANLTGHAPFTSFVPAGTYRVHVEATNFLPYSSALTSVGEESSAELPIIFLTHK